MNLAGKTENLVKIYWISKKLSVSKNETKREKRNEKRWLILIYTSNLGFNLEISWENYTSKKKIIFRNREKNKLSEQREKKKKY